MFIIIAILIGIIPAAIAKKKGKSFMGWWLYGTLLFIVALPHSLIMKEKGTKKCPYCAELVKEEATVCRHCGKDL